MPTAAIGGTSGVGLQNPQASPGISPIVKRVAPWRIACCNGGTMLKTLAFVLLVTATACKPDNAPAQAPAAGASSDPSATPGGPKPRSAKIDVPQRAPGLSGTGSEARA